LKTPSKKRLVPESPSLSKPPRGSPAALKQGGSSAVIIRWTLKGKRNLSRYFGAKYAVNALLALVIYIEAVSIAHQISKNVIF
jgi:hypothetical protein